MLDLGPTFTSEADHLDGLLDNRDRLVARKVATGNAFIDDALGGIYPDDLVVIGAGTGVGKTALVTSIVDAALESVEKVHAFMLEAAPGEVSARLGFRALAQRSGESMDFADFWRGRRKHSESEHWQAVCAELRPKLERLQTLYKRAGDFTNSTLSKQLAAIQQQAQFIALDHLHVIDGGHGHELSTQRETVGLLRDFAVIRGVPVVTASHTRKPQFGDARLLLPTKDDLLGSKSISGVATVIVMTARDWDGDRPQPHLSPTFFKIDKDRRGRATSLIARIYYDTHRGQYLPNYVLGQGVWKDRRQVWEPMPENKLPEWAVRDSRRKGRPF